VKVLKKNKLKIDPARAGAHRMVFDDEGVAMPPLAALAQQRKEVLNAPPGTSLPDSILFIPLPWGPGNHALCCVSISIP